MPDRIVAEEPWSHVLFERGSEFILTFMVGGVLERDFSIKLSQAEMELQKQDQQFIVRLIRQLANNPDQRQVRQLNQAIWPVRETAP